MISKYHAVLCKCYLHDCVHPSGGGKHSKYVGTFDELTKLTDIPPCPSCDTGLHAEIVEGRESAPPG